MKKISTLLLLSTTLFLSTFFVGCKPQEEPIALEDIAIKHHKKVVAPTKVADEPVEIEQQQAPEIQPEEKNKHKRKVIVRVTINNIPAANATVNLTSDNKNKFFFAEKKTDETGTVEIFIPKDIKEFNATAYNDEYTSGNIIKSGLSPDLLTSVTLYFNLKEKGVAIIAVVENKPETIRNLRAEIISATSHNYNLDIVIAATTNISGSKITFPSVLASMADFYVRLTGDNIPQCFSEKFKTKTKREIIVEIPGSVTLKGIALLPDGSPVTNDIDIHISSLGKQKGRFKAEYNIQPETDGSYEITQLPEKQLFCQFILNGYKTFVKNIFLTAPETKLDFSFVDFPYKEIGGIVVTEFDNEPVAGIVIKARVGGKNKSYASCVTDEKGEFTFKIKNICNDYFGEIVVEEAGFAKIIRQINGADNFIKIILRQAGNISGKVMNKNGEPLSGIPISINSLHTEKNVKHLANSSADTAYYLTVSDYAGNYNFKNVVAPAKYMFAINDFACPWALPTEGSGKMFAVDVEPFKTSVKDLIVEKRAIVAVKAKESNGTPVLQYELTSKFERPESTSISSYNVSVSEDEWYYIRTYWNGDFNFSCNASEKRKGLSLVTNDIAISSLHTNYITLIFINSPAELTGHIYNPDGTPARNSIVQLLVENHWIKSIANNKGYFEIQGAELKKGTMMNVKVYSWENRFEINTNLPAGAKNVKLKFQPACVISGKVFIDDLDTPAKNFIVRFGYNQQSFNSNDGSFLFKINRSEIKNDDMIVVSAEDCLPVTAGINFTKNISNAGDIILHSGKTSKISGRVLNQNGIPLKLLVTLDCKNFNRKVSVFTNGEDGTYGFDDVPPGKSTVSVQSLLGFKASRKFEVYEGDDMELPDLILNYTNAAMVKLTFKLPDGTSPAKTRVINQNFFYIKNDGTATGELKAGKYSGWKIKYNDKTYIADEFEITESTDELEIWLREE